MNKTYIIYGFTAYEAMNLLLNLFKFFFRNNSLKFVLLFFFQADAKQTAVMARPGLLIACTLVIFGINVFFTFVGMSVLDEENLLFIKL